VPNQASLITGRIEEALREPAVRSADFQVGFSGCHLRPAPSRPPAGAAAAAPDTAHLTRSAPEETLTIGLTAVWEKWPESLRAKIAAHLPNSRLQLPLDTLERRLRQGSLLFTWKELCPWIEASPPEALGFMAVDNRLELPLPVVAPLFFQHRPFARKNDAPFSSDVPEVFSSRASAAPEPELADEPVAAFVRKPHGSDTHTSVATEVHAPKPPAQPVEAPPEVPDPAVLEPPAPAPAAERVPHNLAELFGEPGKRSWTPNEILQRTCALPGVAGAVMALHDGLLVASCLPPDWRADLLTAFLPQIFGRMGQYCQELQLGPLREVALTVEQGTLQVFQAGLVFFAVLGDPGTLPWPQLRLIAGELSRHTK
jgi:predicted regulator of Ras-like GTPase activity (Roadblock/LC7/MglB family)